MKKILAIIMVVAMASCTKSTEPQPEEAKGKLYFQVESITKDNVSISSRIIIVKP